MKKSIRLLSAVIAILLFALVFPTTVSADPLEDGKTIFGETYTLGSGEILNGDLNVFGGVVTVQPEAVVTGNVFVLGGVVTIGGTVEGDLSVIGGTVTLQDNALIQGNLTSPASYIHQADGAVVKGEISQDLNIPWSEINVPAISAPQSIPDAAQNIVPAITEVAQAIGTTLVMAALGALMLLVMPKSAEVMTNALLAQPWHVLGYGALTALVMLVGGVIMTITICLIPVVILLVLAFGLAVLAGWLALGYQLGKLIASGIFKTTWHPVLTTALGNLALYLLARGLNLIPCLGGVLVVIAALFGLGMSVVTLFGTNHYPRTDSVKDGQPEVLFANPSADPDNAEETPAPPDAEDESVD